MKRIIVLIIIQALFRLTYGQNCNSGYDIFGYNPTNITQNGSWLSVKFVVNPAALPAITHDYKVYTWNFGDGSAIISKTIYPSDVYTEEVHLFDLSNVIIINNGNIIVNPTLKIVFYEALDEEGLPNPTPVACYTETEYVNYAIPFSNFTITLTANPVYSAYPLNQPVGLSYKITPSSYAGTDNLTYSLQKSGVEIISGAVTPGNLNIINNFYTYTPTSVGTHTLNFLLKRNGNIVGTASALTLNVISNGTTGGTGSCTCTDFMPDIDVTYTITNNEADFIIKDISPADYKRINGGCGKYWVQVVEPSGTSKLLRGTSTTGETYPSTGFANITNYGVYLPDVYDPPRTYLFKFESPCTKNGSQLNNIVYKSVTIQPRIFDRKENIVDVPPTGKLVSVPLHTTSCSSLEISNPQNPKDELDWITNIYQGLNLDFKVIQNYEANDRSAEIKVFVNGDYDKCVDVEDGEKMSYRTIKVTQKTSVMNISSNDIIKVALSDISVPNASCYFITCTSGGWPVIQSYYLKTPAYFPVFTQQELDKLSSTPGKEIKIEALDINGTVLNSKTYKLYVSPCRDTMEFFSRPTVNNYDIFFLRFTTEIGFGPGILSAGKSLTVFAQNEINLYEGFETEDGALFEAEINPCTMPKSMTIDNGELNNAEMSHDLIDNKENSQDNNIQVYPNPSFGTFVIENRDHDVLINSVEIINFQGITIKTVDQTGNIQKIDISGSPVGMYFLKINTSDGLIYKKIVIK